MTEWQTDDGQNYLYVTLCFVGATKRGEEMVTKMYFTEISNKSSAWIKSGCIWQILALEENGAHPNNNSLS